MATRCCENLGPEHTRLQIIYGRLEKWEASRYDAEIHPDFSCHDCIEVVVGLVQGTVTGCDVSESKYSKRYSAANPSSRDLIIFTV